MFLYGLTTINEKNIVFRLFRFHWQYHGVITINLIWDLLVLIHHKSRLSLHKDIYRLKVWFNTFSVPQINDDS